MNKGNRVMAVEPGKEILKHGFKKNDTGYYFVFRHDYGVYYSCCVLDTTPTPDKFEDMDTLKTFLEENETEGWSFASSHLEDVLKIIDN